MEGNTNHYICKKCKMKSKIIGLVAIIILGLGVFITYDMLITIITPGVIYEEMSLIRTLFLIGVFFLCGSTLLINNFKNIKTRNIFTKYALYIIFIIYAFALICVLFGNMTYLRSRSSDGLLESMDSLSNNINIIPFKTIFQYINALFSNALNRTTIIVNLFGNLIMFMPMGFFVPYFIPKAKKILYFLGIMLSMLVSIELLQLLTTRGICDIDDIILNLSGALLVFFICKTSFVKKILKFIGIEQD